MCLDEGLSLNRQFFDLSSVSPIFPCLWLVEIMQEPDTASACLIISPVAVVMAVVASGHVGATSWS